MVSLNATAQILNILEQRSKSNGAIIEEKTDIKVLQSEKCAEQRELHYDVAIRIL